MNPDHSYKFPFASIPALRIVLFMILGVVLPLHAPFGLFIYGSFLFLGLFIWILSETVIRRKHLYISGIVANISYLLIICLSLSVYSEIRDRIEKADVKPGETIQLFEWDEIIIEGIAETVGISSSGRWVYVVLVNKTIFVQNKEWHIPYRLRLYGKAANEFNKELESGEKFQCMIRVYSFPERRNPHEFDYGRWLKKTGIAGHGELVKVKRIKTGKSFGWPGVRSLVHRNADRLFNNESSAMAKALLLGYKSELTQDTRLQFSRSGLSHIMAVSGLHVGFIVAPFWLMIPYLWGSVKGRWFGIILLTILLFGYAGLTGFSPSVSRASLMAWFLTYGKLFHKIRNSINLTAVAAIIVLLFQPKQLFEAGFQLSFSAVLIILLLMPEAQRCIPQKYRHGWKGNFFSMILVSVVVQLGLMPILVYYFGEFSVIGPIANALVVPILTFTIPAGLLLVLISPFSFSLSGKAAYLIELPLNWIEWVAKTFGSMNISYIQFDGFIWTIFAVWLFVILFFSSIRMGTVRWKMLIALLISLNATVFIKIIQLPEHLKMEITFLDVGQADAIHIRTPGRKEILIDAGRWSPMSNSGESVLLPYFDYYNIRSLDAVILSHPHADHIGGMPALIKNMDIKKIYQSNFEYDSILYKTVNLYAEKHEIEVELPVSGDLIKVDPHVMIMVLGPEPGNPLDRNPNNHSLAIKVIYGETEFLFTGDAETAQERQMAARYHDFLKSDLYKAGHHGSNTSSTAIFMQYVNPEITVGSLAFRNQFRHPGRDAVSRIHQYSNQQYYTSLSGAIRFTSNGSEIQRIDWR